MEPSIQRSFCFCSDIETKYETAFRNFELLIRNLLIFSLEPLAMKLVVVGYFDEFFPVAQYFYRNLLRQIFGLNNGRVCYKP